VLKLDLGKDEKGGAQASVPWSIVARDPTVVLVSLALIADAAALGFLVRVVGVGVVVLSLACQNVSWIAPSR
jgi:hypothetical protein